jgi:hypothetical protein
MNFKRLKVITECEKCSAVEGTKLPKGERIEVLILRFLNHSC